MKKLIALAFVASAVTAFAGDNIFGCFTLNSSAEEVILGVPWVAPGSADGSIKVTDVIKTDNLLVGDQLYYYADGSYKMWEITQPTDGGVKAWKGAESVSDSKINPSAGGEEDTLTRGNALILKRPGVSESDRTDKTIVIYGQVGSAPVAPIEMARTSAEDGAYTLIAPASPDKATNLNAGKWTNVQPNDCVLIGLKPYYYKEGKWGTRENTLDFSSGRAEYKWTEANPVIPAGCGAWFVAQGTLGGENKTTWDPNATK